MVYFMNATTSSKIMIEYQSQLPIELQKTYKEIISERSRIYYYGYLLGFLLSIIIILYNTQIKKNKLSTFAMVSIVICVSFITNYFYYMLSPKTKWMLDIIKTPEQTKAWLKMYQGMQKYFHLGLVFGIIAIGIFAYAFRC
jgi:hypothetical protein